jgi:Viral alkaline exonuclease
MSQKKYHFDIFNSITSSQIYLVYSFKLFSPGRLQTWHTKKPTSDEPLLFAENDFVKHKEGTAGAFKNKLSADIARHQLLPSLREKLKPSACVKLVSGLRLAGFNVPAMKNMELNDFQPILPKLHSTHTAAEELLLDELYSIMEKCSLTSQINQQNDVEKAFYDEFLKIDWDKSKTIERDTRFQSQSKAWHEQKLHRVTASMGGSFLNMSVGIDPLKRFKALKKPFSSASVRHGLNNESAAFLEFLNTFAAREKKSIQLVSSVGLLVHPNFPSFGASLDRLMKVDNELCSVEVKCPYNPFIRKQKLRFKMKDKAFYVNLNSNDEPFLKENHAYYFQVQMQLMVSNLDTGYFVMYIPPDDIEYVKIRRDNTFIKEMLEDLSNIYETSLLPAFAEEMYTNVTILASK